MPEIGEVYTKAFRRSYKRYATWASDTWIDAGTYGKLDSDGTIEVVGTISVETEVRALSAETYQADVSVSRTPGLNAGGPKMSPTSDALIDLDVSIRANKEYGFLLQLDDADETEIKDIEAALKIIRAMLIEQTWPLDFVLVSERFVARSGILRVMHKTDAGFSITGKGSIRPHGILDLARVEASLPIAKISDRSHSADFTTDKPGTPVYSKLFRIREKWIPRLIPWNKPELRDYQLVLPSGVKVPLDKPYPFGVLRPSATSATDAAFVYDPGFSEMPPEEIETIPILDFFELVDPNDDISEPSRSRVLLLVPDRAPSALGSEQLVTETDETVETS